MRPTKPFAKRLLNVISSNKFYWGVLAFFLVEALWIALSGRYPMAFDEDFHLGIIRLYAHHLSPFWTKQPESADTFGAVFRDPSYLYQYLMSFPYRLISVFTSDQVIQVIILRLINILMFASGIGLFRKLLDKTGASYALINSSLLIFVLLPVTPFLAAQINYDNLFLPITALTLLATINFTDGLKKKKFNLSMLAGLLCLFLLGSIVKYAFLPIALASLIYILFKIKQYFGSDKTFISAVKRDWRKTTKIMKAVLIAGLLLSSVLFGQRYVVNLVEYHSPIPDCSKVMSIEDCKDYGPWIRDYNFKINKVNSGVSTSKNIIAFTLDWFYGMWLRVYFAVGGPSTDYQSHGPLPIPAFSSVAFLVIGLLAAIASFKKVLKRYNKSHILFLLTTSFIYLASLWLDEFNSYLETGQPVAINGRYLLPVLLPIILFTMMSLSIVLKDKLRLKVVVICLAVFCLAWGGGALTYILRSGDNWNWNSRPVMDANHAVQKVIGPITPGYNTPAMFLK